MNNSSTSINTSIEEYIPYRERPETYFVPVLFFLIFVIGVLGNGTLVVIFMRHRNMRNIPNTYILSLALADLLVIVTSIPFTSIVYTLESWPWGELICKISETAKDISVGVSVFTLTALSADRFFAIVDPMKKLHANSDSSQATKVTLGIAVSIWILSIICAIPSAVGSHLRDITDNDGIVRFTVCYPFPTHWLYHNYPKINVLMRFLILYVIPLAIIAIFYLNMAKYLVQSTKNMPGEAQGTQRQIKARKKVAATVLVFVVVFAVCFLPSHVFMMWFYFYPNSQNYYNAFWHYLRIVGFCLSYLNSCANPLALYWVSGTFRKHFNRYLLCIKPTRPRCNTCQGQQHATTLTYMSTRKMPSSVKSRNCSIRKQEPYGHETTITLLGNGHENICTKI
ncbi:neuropeptide CCHamide-1 receptor [Agrilus planipennis]|uniref:Neuropeptide CCHamide-1 receptor n=1 Tax=Agrilus planipennis TaxID=224129 RepID=A0A7F5RKA1_AGRPL|nr:neuropeptide CCHamide-1 receptor [Agrilus planipennis]XP_025836440.1 neuropeptide CCHamide-1 receptor [Agrilus planipennis]XP_025836441.1 neuropeptide CCHamide-1 receptor [Agrilus planipennis]XP_025836442.1 neuropeptide CCHamide-1 receptor [Agrilus planipennis]